MRLSNLKSSAVSKWFGDSETSQIWNRISLFVIVTSLIFGAYLRFQMYLFSHDFVFGPSALANNLMTKSYLELLGQLEARQSAPYPFLVLSKFIGSHFDFSELSLTFMPFLFSSYCLHSINVRRLVQLPEFKWEF